jgi:hypothetical protein
MKIVPAGIHQQDNIIAFLKFIFEQPIGFTAKTPGTVPLHCISVFTGESEGYPVMGQAIPAGHQLRPFAVNAFISIENFPYLVPSL